MPLRPLERKGAWLKVRTMKDGKAVERWVHEQQVCASPGELLECHARILQPRKQ
jgi:hypothetical protein